MGSNGREEEGSRSKSRILIFGGTGYIGSYMVKASVSMGHPTFVYSRPISPQTTPSKLDLRRDFLSMGVTIFHGELKDYEKLVWAIRQVDVVISAVAYPQVLDQLQIIDAIKAAGNIERFLPSDFGCEEDKVTVLPPFQTFLDEKKKIRRATEAAGIPYTFVSANGFGAYFVNLLLHPHQPTEDIVVYGNGQAKAVLNFEEDIGTYTVKVANDPRTCNRVVIFRPPENIVSQLELISQWEKKTSQTFKKVYVPEEDIIKLSETLPHPQNISMSILHSLFIKGDLMNFTIGEDDIEASTLYPEIEFKTVEQLLDIFLSNPPKPATAAFE
ncbi:eugenol synthase 1-like [Malania oleifera]|uniref:eugenol synthase 1-like n=1 Tax=Malania oleifera TaxID=397392 RepID=UPI0025AE51CC|nr:eugenol synthase 1-like [Malania oleifera]